MDRPTKRRRAPEDASISIKAEDDEKLDVNKPSAPAAQASSASFRGFGRSKMEAERLARLGRLQPNVASAPATSSAANDSYAAWSKKWESTFPASLLQEVGKRRNASTLLTYEPAHSKQASQESVYSVLHYVSGGYGFQGAEILGTYNNVASANEHVMVHFVKNYKEYGLEDRADGYDKDSAFPRSKGEPDYNDACWDIDNAGCLTVKAKMDKWGSLKLAVLKQPVLREPPVLQTEPKPRFKPRGYF